MINLLSSGFARLKKSRLFWAFCIIAFLWSALMNFLAYDSVTAFGEIYLTASGGLYLMMPLFYIAPAEAIFCAFFIGTDYSDGTIRNKVLVGCHRKDVYLSNFILTCFAGLMFCAAHLLGTLLVGLPLIGPMIFTSVSYTLLRLFYSALVVILTSAVFTALCTLNSNKTHAVVIGILLSVAMIVVGVSVYAVLEEPEYYNRYVVTAEGEEKVETGIPNPRYVSSPARDVLEWVGAAIPMSASLDMMEPSEEMPPIRIPLCQAGLAVILTLAGIAAFERKDIK